jgi:hypothetical protein
MPVTSIPVQCDGCGHVWDHSLQLSIQVNNGDTISFAPGSVRGMCPQCGALGINLAMPSATATNKGIRGLLAVLRAVPAAPEDLERLTQIALAAKESGAGNAVVAEQIRTSIPSFKPLADWLLSPQGRGIGVATWLMLLATIFMLVVTLRSDPTVPAPHSTPTAPTSQTIIINCPSGQERETDDLLEHIAHEIGELKDSAPHTP